MNPTLGQLVVEGLPAGEEPLVLAKGVELEVSSDAGATRSYSWYCNSVEFDDYRQNPVVALAIDAGVSGDLFVVMRDDAGGVAWLHAEVASSD